MTLIAVAGGISPPARDTGPLLTILVIWIAPYPDGLSVVGPVLADKEMKLITVPSVALKPGSVIVMALGVPAACPAQNTLLKAEVSVVTESNMRLPLTRLLTTGPVNSCCRYEPVP